MTRRLFTLLIISLLLYSCGKDGANGDCGIKINENTSPENSSVLFIGNSHTFYNDMPQMVREIARSLGDSVFTGMSAPGGFDFERHYRLTATIDALNSRKWDYIILQESGWKSAFTPSYAETTIYPFADSLKTLVSSSNPGAKLILYMTNGYMNGVNTFGDTAWCRIDPQVCTYDGMLDRIRVNYIHLATQLNAELAPCGLLWKVLVTRNSNLALHDADGIHPALAGSYANAVALYSVIRKKRMEDIFVPSGVSKEQAELIQTTVSDILFECNPSWKDL